MSKSRAQRREDRERERKEDRMLQSIYSKYSNTTSSRHASDVSKMDSGKIIQTGEPIVLKRASRRTRKKVLVVKKSLRSGKPTARKPVTAYGHLRKPSSKAQEKINISSKGKTTQKPKVVTPANNASVTSMCRDIIVYGKEKPQEEPTPNHRKEKEAMNAEEIKDENNSKETKSKDEVSIELPTLKGALKAGAQVAFVGVWAAGLAIATSVGVEYGLNKAMGGNWRDSIL